MKKMDFKDLKNRNKASTDSPLTREEEATPPPGPRTRISVDLDERTLKKLNSITMNRHAETGKIIHRASVVRDLLLEAIDRHSQTE